jgi:hypothetical protein
MVSITDGDGGMCAQKVDPVDVAFNNLFVGMERAIAFENGGNNYHISLKPKNIGLDPKALLKIKLAGFDAEVLFGALPNLGGVDAKFADIDLMLFDGDIRTMLLNCIFEREMASFAAKVSVTLELESVSFGEVKSGSYEKEIGVNIAKNGNSAITFNLKLGSELMGILNSKFEKVSVVNHEISDDFPFEWHLEVGKTSLSIQDYRDLEEYDIVFLDDDSSFRSGKYEIKGLDSLKLYGKLDGNNLILESENF